MDDYNSNTSRQARFAEQQQADKKQELIDISIQHQILSPFTAFIGVITRTEQENASADEMILREVPIEIRDHESSSNSNDSSSGSDNSCADLFEDKDCEDECDEIDDDDRKLISCRNQSRSVFFERMAVNKRSVCNRTSSSRANRRQMSRSRSRSRSPQQRHRSSSSSKYQHNNDSSPSDIIRQIIGLQNFSGLWSIKNLEEIISFLQKIAILKDIDLKKILNDYKDKDNDIILSIIIMFIFMKYLIDDELLWKPIIKKCAKAMENQLGKNEYNGITDKIRQVV
jgi:hypothetical protein